MKMEIDLYLNNTLSELESLYHQMHQQIEAPVFFDDGNYPRFRYRNISESLSCFLKGIKIISTLKASLVLLREGYAQEVGALCRMIDDFCNEIFFLLVPQNGDKFSKDQIRFLEDFFQEELDEPRQPLKSAQKRVNVPVRKIHSTFGKLAGNELNPSDAKELLRTTHQAFSGYVHGAYPHIMEMYGGNPPSFHMSGMLGTPRIQEWRKQILGYVYRTVMISVFVARKLGLPDMELKSKELLEKFEQEMSCKPSMTADEMLRKIKKKT